MVPRKIGVVGRGGPRGGTSPGIGYWISAGAMAAGLIWFVQRMSF